MADKLFEYVIVHHPKRKEKEEEKRSVLVSNGIKLVLAKDDKEVGMRAAREIPESYLDKLDQVEIIIRPF